LLVCEGKAAESSNFFDGNIYFKTLISGPMVRWAGTKSEEGFWKGRPQHFIKEPEEFDSIGEFRKVTGQEPHGRQSDPGMVGFSFADNLTIGRLPNDSMKTVKLDGGIGDILDREWYIARKSFVYETSSEISELSQDVDEPKTDYWNQVISSKGLIGAGYRQKTTQ
jgi:hypothetical protein